MVSLKIPTACIPLDMLIIFLAELLNGVYLNAIPFHKILLHLFFFFFYRDTMWTNIVALDLYSGRLRDGHEFSSFFFAWFSGTFWLLKKTLFLLKNCLLVWTSTSSLVTQLGSLRCLLVNKSWKYYILFSPFLSICKHV